MTDRGQPIDVFEILGVEGEGGTPPSDPNIEVLAARLDALEKELRLQASYRQQAELDAAELSQTIREKDEAIEGLKAAIEQREKKMRDAPDDPETLRAIVREMEKGVHSSYQTKRQRFIKTLRDATKGTINNMLGHPVLLTINGVSAWIVQGKEEYPVQFVSAWEDYLEDLDFAEKRRELLSGGTHEYDDLENLLAAGRTGEM